MKQLSLR